LEEERKTGLLLLKKPRLFRRKDGATAKKGRPDPN